MGNVAREAGRGMGAGRKWERATSAEIAPSSFYSEDPALQAVERAKTRERVRRRLEGTGIEAGMIPGLDMAIDFFGEMSCVARRREWPADVIALAVLDDPSDAPLGVWANRLNRAVHLGGAVRAIVGWRARARRSNLRGGVARRAALGVRR